MSSINYTKRKGSARWNPLLVLLLIYLQLSIAVFCKAQPVPQENQDPDTQQQQLSCQPGEQRHFNYESSTKVWGSSSKQQVQLRATLRVRCMESPTNNTLKYLVEILTVSPAFGDGRGQDASKSDAAKAKRSGKFVSPTVSSNSPVIIPNHLRQLRASLSRSAALSSLGEPVAEPVFEEVSEAIQVAAGRVKRSVSGWFSKTWVSLKDFFVNIFNSSEKTTISPDQALGDHGIDIAHQCKSSNGKSPKGTLPIDESVFDDLEPEYYIGASTDALGTGYVLDGTSGKGGDGGPLDEEDDSMEVSFFDDPKPERRSKRATKEEDDGKKGNKIKSIKPEDYERMLKLPFVFVQSRWGRIIEVRFSQDETDLGIKNFKRHLCDLFTTNLDKNKSQTNELSPIGKHKTKYVVDSSSDSNAIKDSLLKPSSNNNGNKDEMKQSQQLVRALAVVAANTHQQRGNEASSSTNSVVSRNPNEVGIHATGGLSVLRSINSTSVVQLSSRAFATSKAEIDQMQVSVRQVQQINEGRLVGSAGQLGMSLLQAGTKRPKRSVSDSDLDSSGGNSVGDIADLLQISSSFAIELVPSGKLGSFNEALSPHATASEENPVRRLKRETAVNENNKPPETGSNSSSTKHSEPLVIKAPPSDSADFRRVMREMKKLERQLDFSASTLVAESSREDGQLQRLEIIRDQIKMRLNEETFRNRIRRIATSASQVAAAATVAENPENAQSQQQQQNFPGASKGNDIGLGLTQLVLGNGITSKRKGSVYSTLGETVELEWALGANNDENSMSRLIMDTIRMDKIRAHCKSAVVTLEEIRSQSVKLELRQPFNVGKDEEEFGFNSKLLNIEALSRKNRRKLNQCKRILELMLRLGDRRAGELTIELMDDCNERLLAGAKNEELGYGPASKYYRDLRQQFTDLLVNMNRPNEQLLDKLMARLDGFLKSPTGKPTSGTGNQRTTAQPPEFVYVQKDPNKQQRYNKSLLFEEDNYNNNDALGSLVMAVTSLANKPSIKARKRVEIAEKLLQQLRYTSCSLFTGPDLDIIESMSNFHEVHEEIIGKVIHLARRCRNTPSDQYAIACVHGLQGQLAHSATQRFMTELLRSPNSSCTLKSEIVLTLIGAITADELRTINVSDEAPSANETWPANGINKLDETLLELIGMVEPLSKQSSGNQQLQELDKRCLGSSVGYYMSLKRSNRKYDPASASSANRTNRSWSSRRYTRAIVNEGSFWDEASCKRWSLPTGSDPPQGNKTLAGSPIDLLDELDDVSLVNAINQHSKRGSRQRNQKLVEREADLNATSPSAFPTIKRRNKCSASKNFGPKNAQATLRAEVVNDLVGSKDENKFLARFRLATNFLGNRIDVGRMYLWHQRQVTRAHANVLGRSLWDTATSCHDKAPGNFLYMPLFDFNLWLVKVSVGLNLQAEMGFFSGNCDSYSGPGKKHARSISSTETSNSLPGAPPPNDELELFPTISLRASGEASAKFVVARAGMALASQYSYQGNIRVSRQPESCMSVSSAHQPMNVTFSSWYQLFDNDCHFWGSRNRAEPQATRWRLSGRKSSVWIENECLARNGSLSAPNFPSASTLVIRGPNMISP